MITPIDPVPPLIPAYKDRSTGLLVFGIAVIVLGAFCALAIPFTIFGSAMSAKQRPEGFDASFLHPALLMFSVFAGGLIWLGIGSIKARRWARTLLLCLGSLGLCMGVYSLAMIVPTLGAIDAALQQQGQTLPPAAVLAAKIIMVVITLVMYVLIPGALVLFYGSRHVRLTCEHRDPVIRWTDRCPPPVLTVCLLQAAGLFYMLPMGKFSAVFPLAGHIFTGWPARLAWVAFGLLSLYSAWGFYRLKPRAWWIYFAMILGLGLSSIITFLRVDLLDFYRQSEMSDVQIQQLAASPLFQGHHLLWLIGVGLAPFAGYLLYLRRYFVIGEKPAPSV